jgi:hypothetical protein
VAKTLAELRASSVVTLPERTYPICLAQNLVAEVELLSNEQTEIQMAKRLLDPEGEPVQKPKRLAEAENPRVTEIRDRLEQLYEEMRDHTGVLLLRAQESGWWTTWRDENPARPGPADESGRPTVNAVDQFVTQGWCDSSALLDDLGRYVVSYNDEPMTPENWAFIRSAAAPGDLKAVCTLVVQMQEGAGARAPKASSSPSSTKDPNSSGSGSPEASGSQTADS